uniref:TLC domain containing 2 n=1 Tax=Anas zonorhyncha TaxID=75864 RepID=A0A8B9VEZ4_9AVES
MAVGAGLLLMAGSFAAFRLLNRGLERLVPPPPSAQRNRWKWRNIWTSLAHTALWGHPGGLWGHGTTGLSGDPAGNLGLKCREGSAEGVWVWYFLEDFVDMLCNQKFHQSWELLFHHSVVIVCFGIAVLLHQYMGFAFVALLVEINSIFLHLRQILLMADLVHTTCYRLTSIVNLGTYVVFRITTLAWMTRWLLLNRQQVPLAAYTVGVVGMAIMMPMNIILFYRLLRSDFFKSSRDFFNKRLQMKQLKGKRLKQGKRGSAFQPAPGVSLLSTEFLSCISLLQSKNIYRTLAQTTSPGIFVPSPFYGERLRFLLFLRKLPEVREGCAFCRLAPGKGLQAFATHRVRKVPAEK